LALGRRDRFKRYRASTAYVFGAILGGLVLATVAGTAGALLPTVTVGAAAVAGAVFPQIGDTHRVAGCLIALGMLAGVTVQIA
jgi:hypothetical protein